jgi:hypothetical protein
MPMIAGKYTQSLRALGRLLDAEFAESIELVNSAASVRLSWRRKGLETDERRYQDHNLAELEQIAQQSRGTYRGDPRENLAELWRTLGQDLDREGWGLEQILQERDGFMVAGFVNGQPVRRKFLTADLLASSRARRKARHASGVWHPDGTRASPGAGKPETRPPSGLWQPGDFGPLSRRLNK